MARNEGLPREPLQTPMKRLAVLLAFGAILLAVASCTPRRYGSINRAYGAYPSRNYVDPFSGWDVYQRGDSTRVKYSD